MSSFESTKNKKALLLTTMICGGLLLLFILVSWSSKPPIIPPVQDLMQIDLGNMEEGKGDRLSGNNKTDNTAIGSNSNKGAASSEERINTDPNAETDAAQVNARTPNPRITMPMPGSKNGTTGQDNDQFNNSGSGGGGEGGTGIGQTGNGQGTGVSVSKGNRRVTKQPTRLPGDLGRETIYAVIKVSADGSGSWMKFDKGCSTTEEKYKNAIIKMLDEIRFDKSGVESQVTVKFNFRVY